MRATVLMFPRFPRVLRFESMFESRSMLVPFAGKLNLYRSNLTALFSVETLGQFQLAVRNISNSAVRLNKEVAKHTNSVNTSAVPSASTPSPPPPTATTTPTSTPTTNIKRDATDTAATAGNTRDNITVETDADSLQEDDPKLNWKQRIQVLWKKYGVVAVVTYLTIYVSTLFSIFSLIKGGMLDVDSFGGSGADNYFNPELISEKYKQLIVSLGLDRWIDPNMFNPKAGAFMLAWIVTKFTEPFRVGLTVFLTPRVATWVGRRTTTATFTSKAIKSKK